MIKLKTKNLDSPKAYTKTYNDFKRSKNQIFFHKYLNSIIKSITL